MHLAKGRKKAANNVIRDFGWTAAKMDDATAGISAHHTERVATKTDPGRHNTLTLKTSLECDSNGPILEKLDGRQSSLVKDCKSSGRTADEPTKL